MVTRPNLKTVVIYFIFKFLSGVTVWDKGEVSSAWMVGTWEGAETTSDREQQSPAGGVGFRLLGSRGERNGLGRGVGRGWQDCKLRGKGVLFVYSQGTFPPSYFNIPEIVMHLTLESLLQLHSAGWWS